jgi:hypothetical protein
MQGRFNIYNSLNEIQHINRSKGKNHLFISIDIENPFNKIQHILMIKALMKLGIEGIYLNILYKTKLSPTFILNGEKLKPFPLKSGRTRVLPFYIPIQHSLGIPSQSNKTERRNKRNTNRYTKGRSQTIPICR